MSSHVVAVSRRQPLKNLRGVAIWQGELPEWGPRQLSGLHTLLQGPCSFRGNLLHKGGGFFGLSFVEARGQAET